MTIVLYGLATFTVIFGGGILRLLFGRVLPRSIAAPRPRRLYKQRQD